LIVQQNNLPVAVFAAPTAFRAEFYVFPIFFPFFAPRERAFTRRADFCRQIGFGIFSPFYAQRFSFVHQ
jgi:hypothetical protein